MAVDEIGFIMVWSMQRIRDSVASIHFQAPAELCKSTFDPYRQGKTEYCSKTYGHVELKPIDVVLCACRGWKGHREAIYSVKTLETCIYTASNDLSVKLWDLDGSCLGIFFSEQVCERRLPHPIPWVLGTRVFSHPTADQIELAKQVLETTVWKKKAGAAQHEDEESNAGVGTQRRRRRIHLKTHRATETPQTMTRELQLHNLHQKPPVVELETELSPQVKAIQMEAEKLKAFTNISIYKGSQAGLYGGEESKTFQSILSSASGVTQYLRPFSPLLLSNAALRKSNSTGQIHQPQQQVAQLPVLRLCDNFAKSTHVESKALACSNVNELIEPSEFLKTHLKECSPVYQTRQLARHQIQRRHPRRRYRKTLRLQSVPSTTAVSLTPSARDRVRSKVQRKVDLATALYDDCLKPAVEASDKTEEYRRQSQKFRKALRIIAPLNQRNPYAPYYTVEQVLQFGDVMSGFDNDGSGDIDRAEWAELLSTYSKQTGRLAEYDRLATDQLFLVIDKDDDGAVSVVELLGIVFKKATRQQLQHMHVLLKRHLGDATK